jgi:serine/threonine-protein kinase
MFAKFMSVLAIISGIAAIDYFCDACIKNLIGAHLSELLIGFIAVLILLIVVIAALYSFKKWQQNHSEIEEPTGQVPLNSPFYIERPPIESDCYRLILKPDALIRIKAPRQMGKSSLMTRVLHHAEQEGYHTLSLSFQEADSEIFANLDRFLQWLCASVTEQLDLPDQVDAYWQNNRFNNKRCCTRYFQNYLFAEITKPLVLGLDEVDRIFQEPIATDFFGLLRAWHEKGKNEEAWQKLRLVITHSQEVYIGLDINQSPFNVGTAIELPEFNREQVQTLCQRHQLFYTEAQIEQLMAIVGGHPYLIRVALYKIACRHLTLDKLLKTATSERGPYTEHLRRQLVNLQEHPQLAKIFKTIVTTDNPIKIRELGPNDFKLKALGLIRVDDDNQVTPWCELYRHYFKNRL